MNAMLKFTGSVIWRLGPRPTLRKYSGPVVTNVKTDKVDVSRSISEKNAKLDSSTDKENEGLVAAAFASLNSPETPNTAIKKPSPKSAKLGKVQQLDMQITKAGDIDTLLVAAENPVVSRRHALKMVSMLSEWTSTNKVKLTDFERDPRFLKLCRILARTPTSHAMSSLTMAEDLSTVLGITGDDEAARLITNLTLPQMIKVMKALSQKGRRSTPLLRALSHNIIKQSEVIDLKKSADLLFAMASLNYPEPLLLDRICQDVIQQLPENSKPAVVNSIIVSLGLLRYRHEGAVSALCGWLVKNKSVCRAPDVASTILTLATIDYVPEGCEALLKLASALNEDEMSKSSTWLDLVFSLLILEQAEKRHLVSTLQPEFIDKLLALGEISIPTRRKLMAIDAYTHLKSLSTTRLDKDITIGVPLVYTKEKMAFVNCILDTFKNLVSAESFLKRDCNSGMGFLYDAEFAVDAKCNPVPLEKAANDKSVFRIAVVGLDYHDMTRKTSVPLGVNKLYTRLLKLQGFKVLEIPYNEFDPKDKLITRVKYIESRLKDIVNPSKAS